MKKISVIIASFAIAVCASAQTQTTFFLDNYAYGYRINPAVASERSFAGLLIDNIGVQDQTNMGLASFLYPTTKGLSTGFSPLVSADEFLGNLNELNSFGTSLNENILAFGVRKDKNFFNFEVNMRADVGADLPYDLFAFLKQGSGTYDISALNASARAYTEIALGFSREIGDQLSVGGRIKALVGIANASASFDNTRLTVDGSQIKVDAGAALRIASPLIDIKTKDGDVLDFSNIGTGNFGLAGFGFGIDLGVVYKPIEGLEVSAALNDLGVINWNYNVLGKSAASTTFTGAQVADGTAMSDIAGSLSEQVTGAFKKLSGAVEFHQQSGSEKGSEALNWSANVAARYRMPFYDRLSAGVILSHHNDFIPWNEGRVAATVTPVDMFSLTANVGANSFGGTFGAAASLNLAVLNLHVGFDNFLGPMGRIAGSVAPLGASQTALNAGLTLVFGKRHNAFSK